MICPKTNSECDQGCDMAMCARVFGMTTEREDDEAVFAALIAVIHDNRGRLPSHIAGEIITKLKSLGWRNPNPPQGESE